jgi:hypothetical protein
VEVRWWAGTAVRRCLARFSPQAERVARVNMLVYLLQAGRVARVGVAVERPAASPAKVHRRLSMLRFMVTDSAGPSPAKVVARVKVKVEVRVGA